jgi:hypothetical protein
LIERFGGVEIANSEADMIDALNLLHCGVPREISCNE